MAKVICMLGKKAGRLLVVDREENNKRGQARWRCVCKCGNEPIVEGNNLRNGTTVSCGCFRREIFERQHERSLSHGYGRRGKRPRIYSAWKNARHHGKTQLDFLEFLQQQRMKEEWTCSPKTSTGTNLNRALPT